MNKFINNCNNKVVNIVYEQVQVPHEIRELTGINLEIYKLLNNQYDFDKYYDKLDRKCNIVHISHKVRNELIDISKILIESGRDIKDRDIQQLTENIPEFIDVLKKNMKEFTSTGCEVFVKTVITSGKNDVKILPCNTFVDVISRITNNLSIYRNLVRPEMNSDLVLQEWIDIKYEFRIFICKGKCTAITQQKWYEPINIQMDTLSIMINKILTTNYDWIPAFNGVVDVCFLENENLHMIECNPWGLFLSSGSSLFSWINDYDILYGINSTECVVRLFM